MSATRFYYQGSVRCRAVFRDANGAIADPTTITFEFQNGAGAETTYLHGTDAQLVKEATGTFHVDLSLSPVGTWHVRWKGTGTVAQTLEDSFIVEASEFDD